jgi:hypothetical protein
MVEIDRQRSFRYNLKAGCSKDDLMRYYAIESEEKWNKIMNSIKAQAQRSKEAQT